MFPYVLLIVAMLMDDHAMLVAVLVWLFWHWICRQPRED